MFSIFSIFSSFSKSTNFGPRHKVNTWLKCVHLWSARPAAIPSPEQKNGDNILDALPVLLVLLFLLVVLVAQVVPFFSFSLELRQ
jgi:hypothetical protein